MRWASEGLCAAKPPQQEGLGFGVFSLGDFHCGIEFLLKFTAENSLHQCSVFILRHFPTFPYLNGSAEPLRPTDAGSELRALNCSKTFKHMLKTAFT